MEKPIFSNRFFYLRLRAAPIPVNTDFGTWERNFCVDAGRRVAAGMIDQYRQFAEVN